MYRVEGPRAGAEPSQARKSLGSWRVEPRASSCSVWGAAPRAAQSNLWRGSCWSVTSRYLAPDTLHEPQTRPNIWKRQISPSRATSLIARLVARPPTHYTNWLVARLGSTRLVVSGVVSGGLRGNRVVMNLFEGIRKCRHTWNWWSNLEHWSQYVEYSVFYSSWNYLIDIFPDKSHFLVFEAWTISFPLSVLPSFPFSVISFSFLLTFCYLFFLPFPFTLYVFPTCWYLYLAFH